jgi:cytochrome P450
VLRDFKVHSSHPPFVPHSAERIDTDIYAHNKNVTKSKAYLALMPPSEEFSVLTAWDKAVHGRKRRMIGQGFTEPAVRGYEPIIKENIDILCKQLLNGDGTVMGDQTSNAWSPPMNMSNFGMVDETPSLYWGSWDVR